MLENGKNVVCEEPFCQNTKQVEDLIEVPNYTYILIILLIKIIFLLLARKI